MNISLPGFESVVEFVHGERFRSVLDSFQIASRRAKEYCSCLSRSSCFILSVRVCDAARVA